MNRRAAETNWGLGVIDKLGEARFFLRKMESTTAFTESNYYASAFASACYSVTEYLEARCARDPKQKKWWKMTLARLNTDPVYQYFSSARGADVHRADSIISGLGIALEISDDGGLVTRKWVTLKDGGPKGKSEAPVAEALAFFNLLLDSARDGFAKFGDSWDPTSDLREALGRF